MAKEKTRRILYRGRTLVTGDWEYGAYVRFRAVSGTVHDAIIQEYGKEHLMSEMYSIEPETLGEYTGFKDRNNKMIFEDDIARCGNLIGVVKFGTHHDNIGFYFDFGPKNAAYNDGIIFWATHENENWIEVIGNIHDNPELIRASDIG